jgi:hypothetical protein
MSAEDFIKKFKINKLYSYHEERGEGKSVLFGWILSKSLNSDGPVVISSISKSKKASDIDKERSKAEGNSAAYVSDYNKYFKSLTGETAASFLDKWKEKSDELEELRRRTNPNYRDEEGLFLLSLAKLLTENKKFSKFGRVYKIVDLN